MVYVFSQQCANLNCASEEAENVKAVATFEQRCFVISVKNLQVNPKCMYQILNVCRSEYLFVVCV